MSTNSKLSFVFVVFLSSSFVFHSVFVFVFILYHSILSSSFCLCPSNIYIYLSLFLTSTTPPLSSKPNFHQNRRLFHQDRAKPRRDFSRHQTTGSSEALIFPTRFPRRRHNHQLETVSKRSPPNHKIW